MLIPGMTYTAPLRDMQNASLLALLSAVALMCVGYVAQPVLSKRVRSSRFPPPPYAR
jgi:hypothetical protein